MAEHSPVLLSSESKLIVNKLLNFKGFTESFELFISIKPCKQQHIQLDLQHTQLEV